jgi:hypothetical protein
MRENKLTVEMLGRRLGSGLKIYKESLDGKSMEHWVMDKSEYIDAIIEYRNKPILRNLSSLTKPIKHKGETFVPIEEIYKMRSRLFSESNNQEKAVKLFKNDLLMSRLQYDYVKKLIEWNFHIDEKEGTFIYAEDLDFLKLVISILEEQIKISEERLKVFHYPKSVEPMVKQKINECKEAISILENINQVKSSIN